MPLGIDIGGTKIAFGEVKNGKLMWKKQFPTPQKNKEEIIDTLIQIINNYNGDKIGIGIPGQTLNGYIYFTPHIPLSNTDLTRILQKNTNKKVILDNDANAFLIAEYKWGSAQGHKSAIGITLGTGIGGAILINGKIWHGAHGAGAEFGHMSVIEDGPMCNCGNRGCIETIASPHSIEKWVHEQINNGFPNTKNTYNMKEIIENRFYDQLSMLAYTRFVRYLGMAVANLVNIIDPEIVVFGGSAILSWEIWYNDAYSIFERRVLPSLKGKIKWKKAKFLNDSGVIGAAAIAEVYS